MILDGIRVVDLCAGRAGQLAALLLAEAGAETIFVEAPGGDSTRGTAGFGATRRLVSSARAARFIRSGRSNGFGR